MKIFFGGTFIDKEKLEEAGIDYPIKLEYYKQINEDYINMNMISNMENAKYGIEIIETKYKPDNTKVKIKNIENLTNDEIEENRILEIFKENQVTVLNSEEVILDLISKRFY